MEFVDLKRQYHRIEESIKSRISAVLVHGKYINGPEVAELERQLAEFVGVEYCVGVSSGTDALLVAMMALGIGQGDEVITTPFTFIATGEMIALLGAEPVFVDIDAETYNIDPVLLEDAITSRTRAIMPVSIYGQCADFDEINAIAARHGLPVIEDGAQSFGATYKGRRSCGLSTIGCTSFFPSKPLGCYGDGGACFTNDGQLAKSMREIRNHGQDRRYHHRTLGLNGRLDTMQAAVLLAKMEIFPEEARLRKEVADRYSAILREMHPDKVKVPTIREYNQSVFAQYTVEVDDREMVMEKLSSAGVPTAVHYPVPLHKQPVFSGRAGGGGLGISEQAAGKVLSLPMHPYLDEKTQRYVVGSMF